MEMLKMICLIVWSLVGITTIASIIWALVFQRNIMKVMKDMDNIKKDKED